MDTTKALLVGSSNDFNMDQYGNESKKIDTIKVLKIIIEKNPPR